MLTSGSPLPSQERTQNNEFSLLTAGAETPHLNQLPFSEGRGGFKQYRSTGTGALANGPILIITCADAPDETQDRPAGFRSGRRAKIRHDGAALFSKQAPEDYDGRSAGNTFF